MERRINFSRDIGSKSNSRFFKIFKWIFPAVLFLIALVSLIISKKSEFFAEKIFSTGIFKVFNYLIGLPISLIPFSLTEATIFIISPIILGFFIFFLIRSLKSRNFKDFVRRAIISLMWILSVSFFLYITMHGINYNRTPLSELMGINTELKTPEYLLNVTIDLAAKTSAERELVDEDSEGVMKLEKGVGKTLREAGQGFKKLESNYPFLKGAVNKAKPVALSRPWSYTNITGMYFPLYNEANVNTSQPDKDIPSTAAHELAHLRGFAREDECNFLAYLTGINHDSADYRYSGYYLAYIYCSNALYDYDPEMSAAAREHLSDKVKRDMSASREYWKQFEGPVSVVSNEINNSFIEANGDKDGVLSYSRVVSLILGYYEKEKFLDN